MQITVEPVLSRRQLKEFVRLPYRLYRSDRNWVPQLLVDDYKKLDRQKHPFFKHAEAEYFLARRDGKPVGRIVAIKDRLWEERYNEKTAYWGWFECENDPAVAKALFDEAFAWARKRGCTRIIGPMTPNANELVGTLVEGFDGPPCVMMAYNPPYHAGLIEGYGHRKWKDLFAWLVDSPDIPGRLAKIMPRVEKQGQFTIRKLNLKDFDNEIKRAGIVYNEFEQVNSIFTPMTKEEFEYMGKDMRAILDPDIIFFAEVDGRPVGMSLALPDGNVALAAAHGRMFPFGIIKMLLAKKKIHRVRVLSMGVVKEYRNRGIDLAFYYYSYKYGVPKGYWGAEMSWVEEDNVAMSNTALKLNGRRYRTYRVWEHAL
jgi:GNAT superfamily N-acetyltransferase